MVLVKCVAKVNFLQAMSKIFYFTEYIPICFGTKRETKLLN